MNELLISTENIIDCLNDGIYVCDRNRRIVYWSKSAERITGWRSEDVLGVPVWKISSTMWIRTDTGCAVRSIARCIVR